MRFARGAVCLALILLASCTQTGFSPDTARTTLVYSPKHEIAQVVPAGFLTSYDIHKGLKIYKTLMASSGLGPDDFIEPAPITDEQLLLAHTADYVKTTRTTGNLARFFEYVPTGLERLSPAIAQPLIVDPLRRATGGTLYACRAALTGGLAINLGGGYHHAQADRGRGFCMFADTAVAIKALQTEGSIRRVLIVDLDLHQGNSNAEIFAGDDTVFTFSVHGRGLYPFWKATSDLDVTFERGISDDDYLKIVRHHLPGLIERTNPDLIVYIAGVDLHRDDDHQFTQVTDAGILARDLYVVQTALAQNRPVAMVLAGGYSRTSWRLHLASILELLERYPLIDGKISLITK